MQQLLSSSYCAELVTMHMRICTSWHWLITTKLEGEIFRCITVCSVLLLQFRHLSNDGLGSSNAAGVLYDADGYTGATFSARQQIVLVGIVFSRLSTSEQHAECFHFELYILSKLADSPVGLQQTASTCHLLSVPPRPQHTS